MEPIELNASFKEPIPVSLLNDEVVEGIDPIIFIGANGVGKTSYLAKLARERNFEWIGAQRNLQFSDEVPLRTSMAAEAQVNSLKTNQKNSPWQLASELNEVLSKLKAEDAEAAIAYRNAAFVAAKLEEKRPQDAPTETKLLQIARLWARLFPARTVDFSTYQPKAKNQDTGGEEYGISQMSDGERVALYLISRVIDAKAGGIIIDEPEVHFHAALAQFFWTELEKERADCRFLYVTHDLSFALSRVKGIFVLVKSRVLVEVLPKGADIPPELYKLLVGAASFSIAAKTIIFCEGDSIDSIDYKTYSAVYDSSDTVVYPVGSCQNVIDCVRTYRMNSLVKGLTVFGIIDRDYGNESHPDIGKGSHVLNFHELESLFCSEAIFSEICKHLAVKDSDNAYKTVFHELKKPSIEKNKTIALRVKYKLGKQLTSLLNPLNNVQETNAFEADLVKKLDFASWEPHPKTTVTEATKIVQDSLSGTYADYLRVFPGKSALGPLCHIIGITTNRYVDIVVEKLATPSEEGGLRKAIAGLMPVLVN